MPKSALDVPPMTHKPNLSTVGSQTSAELRRARQLEAMRSLREFKRTGGLTCEALAGMFGVSSDSIERYLSGKSPVPGHVVIALVQGWKVAA
jgi:predicted transcriptional regulator